ncbi:Thioredoxin-like fold [Pseudocohnilembus persalinus]|uniref:Thioredoxin-like fold n=1 Tax=Pseudocohnilembus persalinus TaxID=266149 RepID=A0A0V0QUR3_PSEPJ|nr:Thioredoxin-like fold [Pseudocohnilembus persalinus]|eukprot:KRX05878.1 Thioredoxin-like fold [Pseudocohnilembus persalinus]
MNIIALEENRDYNRMCMNNFGKIIVIIFHAAWHQHSNEYLENFQTLLEISELNGEKIMFAQCDADKVPQVSTNYNITNVPTVIVTDAQKGELKRFENENPAQILESLEEFIPEYQKKFEQKRVEMYKKIEKLITENPVLIFIKGTAQAPECKFTRQFLEIMKDLDCKFTYYDIIADNDMRHWLRHYNKWPTYPQLYISGELIGGLDKAKQRIEEGYIQEKIPQSARIHDPEQRLKKIVSENKVILFTKGIASDINLDQNQKDVIQLLKNEGIKFRCFDCSSDQLLLEHLQKQNGEFPHLYSQQKYIGSKQKLSDLAKQSQLLPLIPGSEWQLNGEQKLKYLLKNCDIIVFINGIPKDCQNEESKQMIEILEKHKLLYEFYNVSADEEVFQNLKNISNYDKVPQLYVKGQLIGGIEAVQKLNQDGDLEELTKDIPKRN